MKFTSEDLLKAMGLKIGSKVEINSLVWIVENRYHDIRLHAIGIEMYLKINEIIDLNYEIIQPKPTLTEDEKVILRNLPKEYKWIVREKDERLWCHTEIPTRSLEPCGWAYRSVNSLSVNIIAFNHLFQFIKWEDEPYSIEELLKE